jgi:hypothetical protein
MNTCGFTLLLALMAVPFAHADDLQDGAAALEKKSYSEALRLFSKAAAAGNADAQVRLGDLYFYGEGVAVDEKAAVSWYLKSATLNNQNAKAALARVDRRHSRQADIAYWTSEYTGDELSDGKYACIAPAIPDVSSTNPEILKVSRDYSAWRNCHNDYVDKIAALLPVGKQIPSDIEVLMTDEEIDLAVHHLANVYRKISAERSTIAAATMTRYEAWNAKTTLVATTANEKFELLNIESLIGAKRGYTRREGVVPKGALGSFPGHVR